jgi:hypothetical protein
MKQRNPLILGLLLALIFALAALLGCWGPAPTPQPTLSPISPCPTPADQVVPLGMTHLTGLQIQGSETDALVVDQTSTGDIVEFRDAGTPVWTLADGGTVAVTGNATLGAVVDVGTWLNITPGTSITLTDGATLTSNGTFQPLTSASAVTTSATTSIADGARDGDLLILINDNASDVINVDGTGANVECKANVALGAGDTLALIWNDGKSNWYCLSNYDNS